MISSSWVSLVINSEVKIRVLMRKFKVSVKLTMVSLSQLYVFHISSSNYNLLSILHIQFIGIDTNTYHR